MPHLKLKATHNANEKKLEQTCLILGFFILKLVQAVRKPILQELDQAGRKANNAASGPIGIEMISLSAAKEGLSGCRSN